ncbi:MULTISPECIES: ATP-binding protein [Nocardiopsidaceae]|jgi:serine/threonine-protein kinase RsbW|uniref:ATP-binding protein n=2 Tax=Nocardiopsidaceae TaxID=83676 RepID=A0ABY6YNP9_9ACTN|nr:ATP-binding protein [Streptomonospora nanhaiensis]MEE2045088.1 ATP-binding protein [Nocardiopsis tropica]WAE73821.1 ATP-binding protein [Streptomonospora nanhaiensis]
MDTVFSISLPRQAYTVSVVRDVLGTLLHRAGLCRSCADDVLLAVSEASANAIDHGGPARDYVVEAELGGRWCELRISHTGRAPDPEAVAERFTTDSMPLPGLDSESGRGILLMRFLMDEVAFEGEPRTTVLLRKRVALCDEASEASAAGRVPEARFALL